jgi:hypothetical protein
LAIVPNDFSMGILWYNYVLFFLQKAGKSAGVSRI